MINSKKKGFTIVELVIVVAVIAILAAVLIPTFSNLVKKANISSDTVLAKNLNTALSLYEAENDVADFEAALEGIKEHGYLISNLNAKTKGCFFVWEQETNQILLVDSTENYKVLFSIRDGYGEPDDSWYFAISSKEVAEKVKREKSNVIIKLTVADMDNLEEVLSTGGEVYLDESIIINDQNLIKLEAADKVVTINLGKATLNTNGILTDKTPITVNAGTLNINNGVIGAAGSYVDADGKVVNTPIYVEKDGKVNIDGTTFNAAQNGYLYLNGENTIKNATINAEFIGIYARGINVLDNTVITSKGRIIWACNHETNAADAGKITINSGTYTGGSSQFGAITTCGSFVEINGGDFFANEGTKLFHIFNNGEIARRSTITITGGTFNGIPFADLDVTEWNALCGPTSKASISDDGKTVTIKFSVE